MKIKTLLLAVLIASPAVASWAWRDGALSSPPPEIRPVAYSPAGADSVTKVPVQIFSKGSAPQWVYIQVADQAVPEPGMISLLALTGLLLVFRRQRP